MLGRLYRFMDPRRKKPIKLPGLLLLQKDSGLSQAKFADAVWGWVTTAYLTKLTGEVALQPLDAERAANFQGMSLRCPHCGEIRVRLLEDRRAISQLLVERKKAE